MISSHSVRGEVAKVFFCNFNSVIEELLFADETEEASLVDHLVVVSYCDEVFSCEAVTGDVFKVNFIAVALA